jgi:hypothetical protein
MIALFYQRFQIISKTLINETSKVYNSFTSICIDPCVVFEKKQ